MASGTQLVRVDIDTVARLRQLIEVRGLSESLGQLITALEKQETSKYIHTHKGLVAIGDMLVLANDDRTLSTNIARLIDIRVNSFGTKEYYFDNDAILSQRNLYWSRKATKEDLCRA